MTTAVIATGSMFNRMRAALGPKVARVDPELKSRDGHLSRDGREVLDRFIGAARP